MSKSLSYIINLRNSLKEECRHMPILQDGMAIIVVDKEGRLLLQNCADCDKSVHNKKMIEIEVVNEK